jgi:flagellar biosynthesis/type III secretory pathway protein FliH
MTELTVGSDVIGGHERSQGRVLKAARVNDELGIAQRKAEADQILDQARSSAAEMLVRAREQGFDEGRSTVLRATIEEVRRILGDFSNLVREREDMLAGVVMDAVEKIIGAVPTEDQLRLVLGKALSDMLDSFTVVLKVAAEDLALVRNVLADLQDAGQGGNIVSVLVDPLLASGEMLLETERGRVHIGLEQQFARLRAGLQQAVGPRS